jgi:hypothetical protein
MHAVLFAGDRIGFKSSAKYSEISLILHCRQLFKLESYITRQ